MSSGPLFGGISVTQGNQYPLQNIAERNGDPVEYQRRADDALAARMRVAMPARVVSFDAEKQTIVAQPLIREKIINRETGEKEWVEIPNLLDIPVVYPKGGGMCMTFPLEADDEVLLVFNDLCIDQWWQAGGVQNWNDRRRHDLSDAVAIPGPTSVPKAIPDFYLNVEEFALPGVEIRTFDGNVRWRVDATGAYLIIGGEIIATADENSWTIGFPGANIELTAAGQVNITGTLRINGNLYTAHRHSGVTSGGSNTGTVV